MSYPMMTVEVSIYELSHDDSGGVYRNNSWPVPGYECWYAGSVAGEEDGSS